MKTILTILTTLLLTSCSEYETKAIYQDVVIGDKYIVKPGARTSGYCILYLHSKTDVIQADIPYESNDLFQIGDTIKVLLHVIKKI